MIYNIFQYSNLLPFLVGLLLWKLLPRSLRIIALIPFFDFLAEILGKWSAKEFHNNMWVFASYRILELFLISAYFHFQIARTKFRKWNWGGSAIIALFGLITTHFWVGWDEYNSMFFTISGFWYILLSLLIYYQMLGKFPITGLEKDLHFFINTGLFIYFSVSFLAFASLELHIKLEPGLWDVFRLSRIFRNIFITAGFLVFYYSLNKMPSK